MITSGLVVDGVSHGLQAHLPYNHQAVHNHHRMSYVEPSAYMKSVGPPPPSPQQQQQQQQQQSSELPSTPEFLRPLPKPAPVNPLKAPRASSKYSVDCRPVNLTAPKEPLPPPSVDHHIRLDDRHHPYPVYGHPRLYVSATPYHPYHPMHQPAPAPYGVYTSPYAPVIPRDTRHHLMQPPQERRYPSPPNKSNGVSVGNRTSPSSSPPEQFKVPNGRDNKPPLQLQQQQQQRIIPPPPPPQPATTVATAPVAVNHNNNNINNNNNHIGAAAEPSPKKLRRNTPEPLSPPAAKTSNFTKGSLIRLANGNIKKVEDMRTEDFLNSVENSDLHRIDPSTVVRIEPDSAVKGNIRITLSYGDQRNHQIGNDNKKANSTAAVAAVTSKSQQVEMESGAEHPYFVFGRGWASWSPAKTLAKYGLTCQRLQVGDVCVSLTKRATAVASDSTTTTTATTTTTPLHGKRRLQQQQQQHNVSATVQQQQQQQHHNHQQQHLHHLHQHHSPVVQKSQLQLQQQQSAMDDDKNSRNKRRWSAPDPDPAT